MNQTAKHKANKHRAVAFGRRAEALAAWWLRLKGYRILARDRRSSAGEIDLIAARGRRIAFVEVKARGDLTAAAEALSANQRRRIQRAAEGFLAGRTDLAGFDVRFDVVLVRPWALPIHVADAWRP